MIFTERQIAVLQSCITPERLQKMRGVLQNRTQYLTLALEDIYQSHNASAVVRTCEALGIQDLHIIQKENSYQVNKDIVLGSSKWIHLIKYGPSVNASELAISALRSQGFRIVACTPHKLGHQPENMDLEIGPMALFIGTEKKGLSTEVLDSADEFLQIPMLGFTESYNLSVFAALCLYTLRQRMNREWSRYGLGKEAQEQILSGWLKKEIPDWEQILKKNAPDTLDLPGRT